MLTLQLTEGSRELAGFHDGDRKALEQCYRDHYETVASAAARILPQVDAETVTHEVFYRLLTNAAMRSSFAGGDLGAWLARVATNRAIDYLRRYARETPFAEGALERPPQTESEDLSARRMVERFRREKLPKKWERVFEARFMNQLPQREAAAALSMSRT